MNTPISLLSQVPAGEARELEPAEAWVALVSHFGELDAETEPAALLDDFDAAMDAALRRERP